MQNMSIFLTVTSILLWNHATIPEAREVVRSQTDHTSKDARLTVVWTKTLRFD